MESWELVGMQYNTIQIPPTIQHNRIQCKCKYNYNYNDKDKDTIWVPLVALEAGVKTKLFT